MRRLVSMVAGLFFVLVGPAFAIETQVDFTVQLMGPNNQAQQDCDHVNDADPKNPFCDKLVPLTLGRLAAAALDQVEPNLKPADIVERGSLARRIRDSLQVLSATHGKLSLDQRDVDLIKDQLAKMREAPSVIDQAYDLLTPPVAVPAK